MRTRVGISMGEVAGTVFVLLFFLAATQPANAAQESARVTQVIKDVKLLGGNGARSAAVNDDVRQGTAVRTGQDSRTELTFTDKTLTRLGANSIFSFEAGGRAFDLGQGSILMQVPPNGSSVKVKTAAVTAAITGGTAIFGVGPPVKFMVLEGTGTFYPTGHPEEAVTLHGGEMVTFTPDGHIVGPTEFNVKLVLETSGLIVDFPDLANLPLIWDVIRGQEAAFSSEPSNPPPKDTTAIVDQKSAASAPSATPGKFGPLSTISSPNPYVINSGTHIQTDPSITTNGVTDFGKIYRGPAQDGLPSAFYFGSTTATDTSSGFDTILGNAAYVPSATFKFSQLTLAGNPTISTVGGETHLSLIGVNGITTQSPGGVLDFAGVTTVLLATQNGAINLTSDVSFQNFNTLFLYARGSGANLTIASPISNIVTLVPLAQNNIDIQSQITVISFQANAGNDFTMSNGMVTARRINVAAGHDISIDAAKFPNPPGGGISIDLNAANVLTISNLGGGIFGWNTLSAFGGTINLSGPGALATFDFSNSSNVTFTAGTGGINAPNINFFGPHLTLDSQGKITVGSVTLPLQGNSPDLSVAGSILAQGSVTSTVGNLETLSLSSNGISSAGGIYTGAVFSGVDIIANGNITATGGDIHAFGNIVSNNGSINLQIGALGAFGNPLGFGNVTAGGNISAAAGIFTPGNPAVVMAGGSITAPGVITGTLQAGGDITIDNTAGNFAFGIIANNVITPGILHMINSPTISPNNASASGGVGFTHDDFLLRVGSIVSTGPTIPVLSSNGSDADANIANPGNGGKITVDITGGGLTIGSENDLAAIHSDGGMFSANSALGGNGGNVIATMPGNFNMLDGSLTATSGVIAQGGPTTIGNGGSVSVTSTAGTIDINGRIEVSSNDPGSVGRRSATGGTILLQSNLLTGAGITVSATGQLLSLLSPSAPGPGGSITLSTMGANITVNGTIEADRGTITLDQVDQVILTPLINIDGATLISNTLNVNSIGDLRIAQTTPTTLTFSTATLHANNNVSWNVAQSTLPLSINSLNVTAGNGLTLFGGNSDVAATLTLNMQNPSTLTAGLGGINAQFTDIHYSGGELNLMSGGNITAHSITFTDFFARGNVNAAGAISITRNLWEGVITAGTAVNVGGSISVSTVTAGTTITAGSYISASSLTAGGDITADTTHVQDIISPTGVLHVASGISPLVFSTAPGFPQGAVAQHTYNVDSIVSPIGIDFSGNQFDGIAGFSSGGLLTINATTITFDSSTGIGSANFNGADVNGFSNGTTPTTAGDGGTFIVNTTGDITTVIGSDITATTGLNAASFSLAFAGAGGTVELNSSAGSVTVDSTIQVSSADLPSVDIAMPFRSSAKGGNIKLTSGKTTGVAINIGSSSQLLALLNAAAPGPGGKITITAGTASGNSSSINIDNLNGQIVADKGLVQIEHDGDGGSISINNANIRADTIKVGALGSNGTLTIGGGSISADSILKLYASGSNGQLNFIANVTLSSGTAMHLAANTITIQPSVLVTINGLGGPANVYTNNPNYSGFGGTNLSNGTFGGNGALIPKPLNDPSQPGF